MDPGFRMYCRQISDGFTAFVPEEEVVEVVVGVVFKLRLMMLVGFTPFWRGVTLSNRVGAEFSFVLEAFPGTVQY